MVLRLTDDLGTSSDQIRRGDIPKSIQCYMQETGCQEEHAREYIKRATDATLKRMNRDILMENPIMSFTTTAMNLARIAPCMDQHGDGFGVSLYYTKFGSLFKRP